MKYLSLLLLLGFLCTFVFFLYWLVTVVAPVATVEVTYQVKKTSVSLFGTSNLASIFIPNFNISVEENVRHPEGSIVIPSLFLDEPIIYNVNPNDSNIYLPALKKGIAHAAGTKLPGFGGLGYYFAHSSNPSLVRQYNAVFYLLGKLKGGEKITVWHDEKKYIYSVTSTRITDPQDVSFLPEEQYKKETIVLQTCWPPGSSTKRLLVFAELD